MSKPAVKHLEMLADPKRAKPTRPVYSEGGYYDQSQLVETKAVVDFAIGTAGVGFILINPVTCGVTNDRPCAVYSTATCSLNAANGLPVTGGSGINPLPWSTGGLAPSGVGGFTRAQLSYRCVACALYVMPTASATSQNGEIYLWESDLHTSGSVTFAQVAGALRTRVIRGVQTGDPSIENVVNWHPKNSVYGFNTAGTADAMFINDFTFRQPQSLATDSTMGDTHLACIATGAAGTLFHAEIFAVFEVVGTSAYDLKPRFVDDAGWNHIANALGRKAISGWVGKGAQVQNAYKHAVVQTAASNNALEDAAEKELKEPVRKNGDSSSFLDGIRKLAPALGDLAKEAVGFML